jgi:hypothetical protein
MQGSPGSQSIRASPPPFFQGPAHSHRSQDTHHPLRCNKRGVFKSANGGDSWNPRDTGLPSDVVRLRIHIDPKTPSILYVAANSSIFKSTNGADSWTELPDIGSRDTLALDPQHPMTL